MEQGERDHESVAFKDRGRTLGKNAGFSKSEMGKPLSPSLRQGGWTAKACSSLTRLADVIGRRNTVLMVRNSKPTSGNG